MTALDFANQYRPKRFEDVLGQDHAVEFLSELIKRGQHGLSVLLYGEYGSSKTSLAEIYSKALNCEMPTATGSPCNTCKVCTSEVTSDRHQKFDWTKPNKFIEWLGYNHRAPSTNVKWKTLFIDEAHLLSDREMDVLLQAVENPADRVVFCFATTEPEKLKRPLRSRLIPLEVKPLPVRMSVELLKRVAKDKRIPCTRRALRLLAGLKAGHPRDLLFGLQQVVTVSSGRVSLEAVRFVFDLDHAAILTSYFGALADRDFDRQTEIIFSWREKPADKTRWIVACLTSLYYKAILRRPLILDGVVDTIVDGCETVVERFCRRLGVQGPDDLAPYWRSLMAFWSVRGVENDDATIRLRLTLFHELVNAGLPPAQPTGEGATQLNGLFALPRVPVTPVVNTDADDAIFIEGEPFPLPPWLNALPHRDPAFFGVRDARELMNRASYLTQEHGVLFNVRFELRPFRLGAADEAECRALVEEFNRALQAQVAAWGWASDAPFACLMRFENDEDDFLVTIAAHLPRLPQADGIGTDCVAAAPAWVDDWMTAENGPKRAIKIECAKRQQTSAVSFHWRSVLRLCGGLNDDVTLVQATPSVRAALVALAKKRVPRRISGRIEGPLIQFSTLLEDDALRSASRNRMEPLSAFDAQAWDRLTEGWELKEFEQRRNTKEARAEELRELAAQYGRDREAIEGALKHHAQRWAPNPEHRQRRWQGWWVRREA